MQQDSSNTNWDRLPLAKRVETAIGLTQDCGGVEAVYRVRDAVMKEVQAELARQRTGVLREALEAVQSSEQRAAVGGGLGWETARDVLHRMVTKAQSRP
ncbi:hypothetical protein [Streptomyces lydicus]|uniref:hypothetical protein n=1 Tax=Streptomyces lydicus TaxID=47763 RepID=UPI00382B8271